MPERRRLPPAAGRLPPLRAIATARRFRSTCLVKVVERIVATVDVPLSVDFEGAYAVETAGVGSNAGRIVAAGAIGVNFEDRVVAGDGLHAPDTQAARIAALRTAGDAAGIPLFINARTDLFLREQDRTKHGGLVDEAIARALRYSKAGASGFFVPGLVEPDLIGRTCGATELPVNFMVIPGAPSVEERGALGVARQPWARTLPAGDEGVEGKRQGRLRFRPLALARNQ